jgi:hypothetical protein
MPKITELFLISVKSLKVSRNIFFGFARWYLGDTS